MDQFDIITAVFNPRRSDDLVEGAADWIGKSCQWQAAWVIEEGEYSGEWAMTPHPLETLLSCPFAWVPSGDLYIIEPPPAR